MSATLRTCDFCQRPFVPRRRSSRCCSTLCSNKANGKRRRMPAHVHPVVASALDLIERSELKQQIIADKSGVHRGTITHWRSAANPTIPNLDAVLGALGYKLAVVPLVDAD